MFFYSLAHKICFRRQILLTLVVPAFLGFNYSCSSSSSCEVFRTDFIEIMSKQ